MTVYNPGAITGPCVKCCDPEPVSERVIEEIACELEETAKEAVGIANSTLLEKYDG